MDTLPCEYKRGCWANDLYHICNIHIDPSSHGSVPRHQKHQHSQGCQTSTHRAQTLRMMCRASANQQSRRKTNQHSEYHQHSRSDVSLPAFSLSYCHGFAVLPHPANTRNTSIDNVLLES
eukprot:2986355-Rhodomonas_salina.2